MTIKPRNLSEKEVEGGVRSKFWVYSGRGKHVSNKKGSRMLDVTQGYTWSTFLLLLS